MLYPNIGRLPSKYGIYNFEDKNDLNGVNMVYIISKIKMIWMFIIIY